MDFFQRARNFFTGSGWSSDEEKKRKKKQQAQQPQQKPKQPSLVQNQPKQTNTILELPKQKPQNVFSLGQPQKKPPTAPVAITPPPVAKTPDPVAKAVNAVGNAIFTGTARGANSLAAGAAQAGNLAAQTAADVTGNQKAKANAVKRGRTSGESFLKKGGGIFGSGGLYNSWDEASKASALDVIKRVGANQVQSATEIVPAMRGYKFGKAGTGVTDKIISGAKEGATMGAVGGVADSLATGNEVTVDNILLNSLIGAGVGGGAASLGSLIKRARGNNSEPPTIVDRTVNRLRNEAASEIIDRNIPAFMRRAQNAQTTYKAQQSAERGAGNVMRKLQDNGFNPGEDVPAFMRRDVDKNIATAEEGIANIDRQIDSLPDQSMEAYKFKQKQKLADDIRANPQARDALIAQYEARIKAVDGFDGLNAYKKDLQERRAQLVQLLENSKLIKEQSERAVTKQGENIAQTEEQLANNVEEAVQTAEQRVAPTDIRTSNPEPTSPEIDANDAYSGRGYNQYANELVDTTGVDRDKGLVKGNALYNNPLTRLFTRAQQGIVGAISGAREGVSDAIQSGVQSGNGVTAGAANLPKTLFKNFGLSDSNRSILTTRTSQLQNASHTAKLVYDDMEKAVQATGNPAATYEKIYRVLETPDFLKKVYGDETKLTPADLTPEELVAFEKLVAANKVRNALNFDTGLINAEQYAMYSNGLHSPRVYDLEALGDKNFDTTNYINRNAGKKRKDINEIDTAITSQTLESPFQASALRLEQALKNKANAEALINLENAGLLFDRAPNKNFVKLEGKKYGSAEGKYIDKQLLSQFDDKEYYNSQIGQKIGDTIEAYQQSPLGGLDRLFKSFKTILSPGTFAGNIGSNIFAFAGAANVNPATAAARMAQGARQLVEHSQGFNANVYRAEQAGLFAGDTGRAITGARKPEEALGKPNRNPYKLAQSAYGGTDKAFALGLFNELKARGLSDADAVARTHLATQNYANAGRVINNLADAPILGKPFARFTPELLRIMKNNLIYNPVGTAAKVGGLAYAGNKLSDKAGETDEERKAREEAVGQTQLPGTSWLNRLFTNGQNDSNVSLNLPIGESSVNIARATGLNYPIEPGGTANTALVRQLSPIADMTRTNAQGEEVFAPNQLVSSLFFRPIADQIANRDFMGREITDPDNKTYYEGQGQKVQKFSDELNPNEQNKNRLMQLAMSYLPFSSETNAVVSAAKGEEDYYGKERSVSQAILRALGLKTESNAKDVREKRVETRRYFEEDLPAVQGFLQQNPDLANTYFKLRDPSRNRNTNQKTSDLITPEKWDLINSDTSGRLFNFLKTQALNSNEREGRPLDPVYTLPPDQAKYVTELRSRPSGDDIEAQEILRATTDWYPAYEDNYYKYLNDNTAFFENAEKFPGAADANPRVAAYSEASPPVQQPDIIKQYYQIKNKDVEQAKIFYKLNKDALSGAFNSYAAARLERINKLRKIEGYEPISLEVFTNKTFGFDPDGAGSGYGYGGGRDYGVNNLGELTGFSNDVARLKNPEAESVPQLATYLQKLFAGSGGGRQKPRLGASSRGQG